MDTKEQILTELYALLLKYNASIWVDTEPCNGEPESIVISYEHDGKVGDIDLHYMISPDEFIELIDGEKYKWEPQK